MQHITDTASWQVTEPGIMDTDRYLSSANAPDFEEDLRLVIESGAREIIVNCASLTYLTGAGLRTLMNLARVMQTVGGNMSVQGLKGQPHEIFFACGMESVVPVMDQEESMLSALRGDQDF